MKNFRFKTCNVIFLSAVFAFLLAATAFASNGVIYFSDPQTSVGETVNVNIKVETDSAALGRADITLRYPADALEFIEGHNCDGGAGVVRIHGNVAGGNVTHLDYSISFKALKAGRHSISVDSSEVYDMNEQEINLTHTGSSTVAVSGGAESSSNALLKILLISPGSLTPEFDPQLNAYSAKVGPNVDSLAITAEAEDSKAVVSVSGNEHLIDGENIITITVASSDGTNRNEYSLTVQKTSDGEENVLTSASEVTESQLTNGVQLSSKGKTITVMDLPPDINVPGNFREGTISIDGNPVQGLVSSAEGAEPEYIVIYGMNDKGEMNFYRFDMKEKTIQRYFTEPVSNNTVPVEEFNQVQIKLNELSKTSDLRFILICILGVLSFALLISVVLLAARLSSVSKENKRGDKYRTRNEKELLMHGYTGKAEDEASDRTVVISKKSNNDLIEGNEDDPVSDETVIIKNKKDKEDGLDGFEEFKL